MMDHPPAFLFFYLLIASLQFLPVIGRIVSDAIEGKLEPAIARKFAVDRKHRTVDQFDPSRGLLKPVDLNAEPLCTPEDLLPCPDDDNGGS
jgi:sarcosine oxidase/L-pipecolate oxidase